MSKTSLVRGNSERQKDSTVQSARESAALIVGALTNTRGGLAAAGASVTHRARGCACAWGGGGRRSQLKRVRLIGFRPVVTAALIALVDGEQRSTF